jgi:poly-gamma-glutamate capsule biosynthesis protein CapA/YwtB (metallophosphatase superfamily)
MAVVDVLLTGDLVLEQPNADFFFDVSRDALRRADLRIGHVETPHTLRGQLLVSAGCPANDPEELKALGRAGFEVATLAANHIYDRGVAGVEDTLEALHAQGILTTGAGLNLEAAKRPAVIGRNGVTIGVLSYNCVGPSTSWAGPEKAGCAYLEVLSHFEPGFTIGAPPRAYTFIPQGSLEGMQNDIEALKQQVDVVIVALHKGIVHTPVVVLDYERLAGRAAIDAGADLVISHHAHILRGIDIYKGRPIYHGLGNFVTVTLALDPEKADTPGQREYARRRRKLFGFEPDPNYPLYPFHPQAKNGMVASVKLSKSGVVSAGFLPLRVLPTGQPEILGPGQAADEVVSYVADITRQADLKASFAWDGDRVVVS